MTCKNCGEEIKPFQPWHTIQTEIRRENPDGSTTSEWGSLDTFCDPCGWAELKHRTAGGR